MSAKFDQEKREALQELKALRRKSEEIGFMEGDQELDDAFGEVTDKIDDLIQLVENAEEPEEEEEEQEQD